MARSIVDAVSEMRKVGRPGDTLVGEGDLPAVTIPQDEKKQPMINESKPIGEPTVLELMRDSDISYTCYELTIVADLIGTVLSAHESGNPSPFWQAIYYLNENLERHIATLEKQSDAVNAVRTNYSRLLKKEVV